MGSAQAFAAAGVESSHLCKGDGCSDKGKRDGEGASVLDRAFVRAAGNAERRANLFRAVGLSRTHPLPLAAGRYLVRSVALLRHETRLAEDHQRVLALSGDLVRVFARFHIVASAPLLDIRVLQVLERGYIVRVFSSKPVDPLSASSIQAYRAGKNDIFEHVGRRGQVLWTRPTSKYDRVGMLAQRIVQVLAALHVLHRSVLAPTESMCARADGVEDGKIGAVGRGRRRGRVAGCLDAARSHRAVRAGADGHKTGGHAGQRERKRVQAASRRGAKS